MASLQLTPKQYDLLHTRMLPSASGCILWAGMRNKKGYGLITLGVNGERVRMLAHRLVYSLAKGDPDELSVCHSCDNPACVRPDHLRLGTHTDNMRDISTHGYHPQALKTEGPHGHPYSEENTGRSGGKRYCRTCKTAQNAASYQRRKAA